MFIFFMVDFENSSRKYVDRLLVCFFVREGHFMYKKDICSGSKGSCWISFFRRTSFIEQELNTISQRNYIINKMRFRVLFFHFPIQFQMLWTSVFVLMFCWMDRLIYVFWYVFDREEKSFGIIIHSWNAINSILHRCVFFSLVEIPIRNVCIACEKKVESMCFCVCPFSPLFNFHSAMLDSAIVNRLRTVFTQAIKRRFEHVF